MSFSLGDAIFQLLFLLLIFIIPAALIAIIIVILKMKKSNQQLNRIAEKLDQLSEDKQTKQ